MDLFRRQFFVTRSEVLKYLHSLMAGVGGWGTRPSLKKQQHDVFLIVSIYLGNLTSQKAGMGLLQDNSRLAAKCNRRRQR